MIRGTDPLAFIDCAELDPIDRLLDMSEAGDDWYVNDSTLADYSELAGLPRDFREGLGGMILENLGVDSGNVGIDIAGGANGVVLQELLSLGILDKALVTNFTDTRSDETKGIEQLDHIDGDLHDRSTWEEIQVWIKENAPDGLALAMHRPAGVGPLQHLPIEFYEGALDFILQRMRTGGLGFFQVPERLVIPSPLKSLKPIHDRLKEEGMAEVLFSSVDSRSDFPVAPAHVLLKKT